MGSTFRNVLLVAGLLLAVAVLVLIASSHAALDRDFSHSSSTAALPLFGENTRSGLVRIPASGFEFRARVANFERGAIGRPAVILLHGFPQSSAMWEPLIRPLVTRGYRVVAFDQRGYSPGARPTEISDYQVEKLVGDVLAVADATGLRRFHVVGHDWGAIVAWATAITHPQRVASLSALSVPHPAAFTQAVREDPDQRSRSRYMAIFAMPWLPERLLSVNDMAGLRALYGDMDETSVAAYLDIFREPGALGAALNWYRALARTDVPTGAASNMEVTVPTLFIRGSRDPAIGPAGVKAQASLITGPYRKVELDAGHWLMEEVPRDIISEVLPHLNRHRRAP